MAKKGGTTDINGFVGLKGEDAKKTKQKISPPKNSQGAGIHKRTSELGSKEESDSNSKRNSVANKDSVEKKNTPGISATKPNKSVGGVESKVKLKVLNDATKTKSSTNPTKDRISKEQGVKLSDKRTKITASSEQNISGKVINNDAAKRTKISTSQRGAPSVKNATEKKIVSRDVKNYSSAIENKDKSKLEISKTEKTKSSTLTKKSTENEAHGKNGVSKSKDTSKSRVSLTTVPSSSPKQKKSKSEKSVSSDKERKTTENKLAKVKSSKEETVPQIKEELPQEDASNKSSYKDLIYFEVDMGNSKEPSSTRVKSARMKSAALIHPPLSRQGTFTKDESPTSLENMAQEISKEKAENEEKPTLDTDDYEAVEYEDDFEDYESDFEEYVSESSSESGLSSKRETDTEQAIVNPSEIEDNVKQPTESNVKMVEEEKKLDSGHYDLSSKPVLPLTVKQKQLDFIKEVISQENASLLDSREEISLEKEIHKQDDIDDLDFMKSLDARKENQRSSIILQMITLHQQNINLFEETFADDNFYLDMYPPDVSHALTETDFMKEEETQTNVIMTQNKWTQFPISYHPITSTSIKLFIEDRRGFGGDNLVTDVEQLQKTSYDKRDLYRFIDSASKVLLVMLEEESRWRSDKIYVTNTKDDLPISDGCIPIEMDNLSFLKDLPICDILFSSCDPNVFVSSHQLTQDVEILPSDSDHLFEQSILCVWSMLEPSQPLHLLVASYQICAVTFDLEYGNLLYAGLTDGSVCLWDLNESSIYHKETTAGSMEYLLRTPTFCSSYLVVDDCHHNDIISIKSIGNASYEEFSSIKFNSPQVLTLDADGKVVLWIVVSGSSSLEERGSSVEKFEPGISEWGKYKLAMGRILDLEVILPKSMATWDLQFLCMSLAPKSNQNTGNVRNVLAGTNAGSIVHFEVAEDEINVPVFYSDVSKTHAPPVMCIESDPHNFPVFLAGCQDGKIRFYILDKPRPFKVVFYDEGNAYTPISKIRWSPIGLGIFLALDKNFRLHVWDVCKGDLSPQMTVSLNPLQAEHFDLTFDGNYVYIGLPVQKFQIKIHRLKKDLITTDPEQDEILFERLVKINSNVIS